MLTFNIKRNKLKTGQNFFLRIGTNFRAYVLIYKCPKIYNNNISYEFFACTVKGKINIAFYKFKRINQSTITSKTYK